MGNVRPPSNGAVDGAEIDRWTGAEAETEAETEASDCAPLPDRDAGPAAAPATGSALTGV